MTIHNGTKSERTSFALYGTLSAGASISGVSGEVFICVGPITVKSDELRAGETDPGNQTFTVGTISFSCGQNLTLTNNYLAWTDASGTTTDRCNTFAEADECADIAPKCGTAASINIEGPLASPTLAKVDPSCTTSTGSITVTSSTTGLLFKLDNGSFAAYPSGGWTGLSSGEHCVRAKRSSGECVSDPACVTIGNVPPNPVRPVVTLQEATICGTRTAPTITVSCPANGTYKLTQPQETDQTFAYNGSNGPVVFTVKPGKGFSITLNSSGCISDATTCNNMSNTCPSPSTLDRVFANDAQTLVKVAPNPYNDRIRFTFQASESGKGILELYTLMGQKVKTVFEGRMEKGQSQVVEYTVPFSQRSLLVYVFRIGNQKSSGKLLSNR